MIICTVNADLNRIILRAHERGISGGKYAYIGYTISVTDNTLQPWGDSSQYTPEELALRKAAFANYRQVSEKNKRINKFMSLFNIERIKTIKMF